MDAYQRMTVANRLRPSITTSFRNQKILNFAEWGSNISFGKVPNVETLIRVFKIEAAKQETHLISRMMGVRGRILKCDHTFKMAKIIKVNRDKPFAALFSVMNEFNEIVGFWLASTKKISELRSALEQINARYQDVADDQKIQVMYTDNCCSDRKILQEIFGMILVKLDVFHLMNRLKVKKKHRFFASFMKSIQEALMCSSQEDEEELKAILVARGNEENQKLTNRHKSSNKRRRTYVAKVCESFCYQEPYHLISFIARRLEGSSYKSLLNLS
jgi:hypothetical protein